MFIGHFGVAFGAKAAQPRVSLGSFFLAAQFVDLLWPTFLLLGIEKVAIKPGITEVGPLEFVSYPISHSLLMGIVWGIMVGFIYWLVRRNRPGAIVMGLIVLSHWILDLVVHVPDLPLYPGGSTRVGLGLWNSLIGTQVAEGVIFTAGLVLYLRSTTAKNKKGIYGLWTLVGFLLLVHISSLLSPPPTSTTAIAWMAQLQWIVVGWAYWVDRNRIALLPEGNPTGPPVGGVEIR